MQLWQTRLENLKTLALKAPTSIVILLVRFYQVSIAQFLGGRCRFTPSCSEYCIECFRAHSFFKAFNLSIYRLSRCHPLGQSGFDPVPEVK